MKKIVLITLEYPPIVGGVSTYLHELYTQSPFDVTIISPETEKFFVWWIWPRWIPFYFRLKKRMRDLQPDEIHVSHVLPIGMIAFWLSRSLKIPYTIFFHGTDLKSAAAQPRKWKRVKKIVAGAKRLIVNSEATKKLFISLLPDARVPTVILPGVTPAPTVEQKKLDEIRNRYAIQGTRVILFLARLVERKGIFVALDAISILMKKNIEATLVIVGDGPLRARAEERAHALELFNRIRFVGGVSDAEKWAWYSISELFWFPAQPVDREWEGFGITSIEAQSMGCPAIVSRCDGLPESILEGKSGFSVDSTAESFASITQQIFEDRALYDQLCSGARAYAGERTGDQSRAAFNHLIDSLI